MKLMLVGSWSQTTLEVIGGRFAAGEHSVPPEPCQMLARWHDPSSKLFWVVVDAPEIVVIQEWMSRWSDIVDWETFTALDDAEVGGMLETLL